MAPATPTCKHSNLDTTTTSTTSNDSGVSVSRLCDLSMQALQKQFSNYGSVDGRFTPPETPPEMPQKERSPVPSCSDRSAKSVSDENTTNCDPEPSCSYNTGSSFFGKDSDDSEVDQYYIRETEDDVSDEEVHVV